MAAAVIPTYNEAENIQVLVRQLQELTNNVSRIFIVDDGSNDGTGQIVQSLDESYGSIVLIQRGAKLGFGSAIRDGLTEALKDPSVDRILQMDADLSHKPEYLDSMFAVDADIVIGSRYVEGGGTEGWGYSRRIASRAACWLVNVFLGLPAKDSTAGFKLYSRRASKIVVEESKENLSMGAFEIETIYLAKKHNLTVREVPIVFINRERGKSKAGLQEISAVLKFILHGFVGWDRISG